MATTTQFTRPLSLEEFRGFALAGDINAARHLNRQQLELIFRELLSHFDDLPLHTQYSLNGALTCAMQAAMRGEAFE